MSCVVLYHTECTWEIDYVFKTLLGPLLNRLKVHYLTSDDFEFEFSLCTQSEKTIVVFSSNCLKYDVILNFCKRVKPHIVFHMSDEYGTRSEYTQLATHVPLVFRQHNFASYPKLTNEIQIPLGYKTGFTINANRIPASQRKYKWSFVGIVKNQERKKMLETYRENFAQEDYLCRTDGKVSTSEMSQMYQDSVFVPNDRGNVRLDCFRIYEAILAGAIPVLVGTGNELEETFAFSSHSDFPPFVVADSWPEAVVKCKNLLQETEKLNKLQTANIDWLYGLISRMQQLL